VAELEQAFAEINGHEGGAYLEVLIPAEESQPLAEEVIETIHKTATPHSTSPS
jgi:indolepyruvate decarboxylase